MTMTNTTTTARANLLTGHATAIYHHVNPVALEYEALLEGREADAPVTVAQAVHHLDRLLELATELRAELTGDRGPDDGPAKDRTDVGVIRIEAGKRIRRARIDEGVSVTEAGERSGLGVPRWEALEAGGYGDALTVETIRRVSDAIGAPIFDVLSA